VLKPLSPQELDIKSVSAALDEATGLTPDQKAKILVYCCDNPVYAAGLPKTFCEVFFQKILEQLL